MIMIDEATAIVTSESELSAAVGTDNGIDLVYLDADITMTAPISISSAKLVLVIDGTYNGTRHTFMDMNSTNPADTIGVRFSSNITLTFQNMTIIGRNYYGVPYFPDVLGFTNVTAIYKNITYNGVQLVFNPNGLTHIEDCDINIDYPAAPTRAQEVGEVCRLELAGNVNITHNSTNSSAFWFRGDPNTQFLRVFSGANITVNTTKEFMYAMTVFFIQRPVVYDIQPDAKLSITSRYGMGRDNAHRAASFALGARSSFTYTQLENNSSSAANASFCINGGLTVNADSRFYMQADYLSSAPLLNFMTSAANLSVLSPKSFVLYNRNNNALAFSATANINLTGGQVNYWTNAILFPTAGTFDDIPQQKWFKGDATADIAITGTASSTTALTTNLTAAEAALMPDINLLELRTAKVLSVGRLVLSINPIVDDQTPITGMADPNAKIRAAYTVAGTNYTENTAAQDSGYFFVGTAIPLPIDTVVTVSTNLPFLIYSKQATVIAAGELTLVSAPDTIEFVMPPISTAPLLLGRDVPDSKVVVHDTRVYGTRWKLTAVTEDVFKTASGHVLPDALVYVDDSYGLSPLGSVPVVTYTGNPVPETEVVWDFDKGILVNVKAPVRNGETYYARLIWAASPI